jgi:hypothetical protein
VFELLKRHLCLEVSAIAMIDLGNYIMDSHITYPVLASRIEEALERPLPASGGAGSAPPPKTTAPAGQPAS